MRAAADGRFAVDDNMRIKADIGPERNVGADSAVGPNVAIFADARADGLTIAVS